MILSSVQKHILTIFLLYLISYFLFLFNSGIFWDDWTIWGTNPEIILKTFFNIGNEWVGRFHVLILQTPYPIFFYRMLTFLSYLFSTILVYYILRRVPGINEESAFWIALFYGIFPVNWARITLICVPYAIFNLCFFVSFFIIAKSTELGRWPQRYFALPILFISYFCNSLLPFTLIIVFFLWLLEGPTLISGIRPLSRWLLSNSYFFLLPVLFFFGKPLVFPPPTANYASYNTINLKHLLWEPLSLLTSLYDSFIHVIDLSIMVSPFLLLIVALTCYQYYLDQSERAPLNSRFNGLALLFGLFSFFLGIFPYLIVGKYPHVSGFRIWESRHQLLVPLGASFMLIFMIKLIHLTQRTQRILLCVLATSFVLLNIQQGLAFQRDWFKQVAIVEQFKKSEPIKNGRTFKIVDQFPEGSANDRFYCFYEYTALLKLAFGDEIRYAYNKKSFVDWNDPKSSFRRGYSMTNYTPGKLDGQITISQGVFFPNTFDLIRYSIIEKISPKKFRDSISNFVSLEYTPQPISTSNH